LADVNSNININFDTTAALAQLRSLQAGLSRFHQSLAEGNLAAANAQKGLNAQLLQSVGATGKFSASQVKVAGSTLAFTSALEKNKLSLREYYRYTMAAATANTRVMGKAFAQEREIINRARRDRVKALQAQYIQMNKSNAGFMDAIRIMPKSLQMASGKFTELGTRIQYAAQRQQFLNQLLKQGSTQLLNFGKNTQWAGRQLMVGLTMPLALFGSAAAKSFRELETAIVKFKRVYGNAFTNESEVNLAVENIRALATEYTKYGVSVTKTMEMAGTAAAAGFSGRALTAQVETATKLAVLGQIEQQQALETTISLQNAFGLSSEELAKKIDFLNAVENQTVLSIEDLTIAIPKAAPIIKQLGGSVEDLAFFLTAMKEGGINASEGANALKSGLASMINPSKKAAAFLGDLGINIKGIVEANAGNLQNTIIGFAQALDTLDPLNRARAIEQMFGKFQFSRLSTLFQNVTKDSSQASRALSLAGSSVEELAILSEREMGKIEDSVGVKFQAAIEQFKQDIMPLGKIFLEALTPVVKFFGGLFEKFNGLGDSTKKVIAVVVAAVAGLGPIVLMTFGLLMNAVANAIKLFSMLRGGIAKLNGQTNIMGAGFNYMTQEQIENAASSNQLHQTHSRLVEVFNVEKTSVNALAASYNSLSTQMRSMASQNPALFAGGRGGATRAVSKLPPTRKYKDGILSVPGPKGAGDVVPAMLSPGEAVIPTDTTNKYRGLISAMFKDKVPGFMAGRLPGGPGRGIPLSPGPKAVRDAQQARNRKRDDARQGYSEPHPEKKTGPTFIGMPKSSAEASQSRQILDKISNQVKLGQFGSVPPTNFGTMLQSFSGRSFPARGVGGVYRKPNGQIVVVKPTIDEKTALAEVRATQIAREVHGLVSPKQTIKTMMDPTDPTGQRKFIVIESPYDPRIAAMSGKFSKSEMVKQLVASTLRGDKDLQRPNLSGNVLADVGTAGVFDRASGFRDFAKVMPSMEQQAVVNLLGVKGGAKKFFAQETSGVAASMSPRDYDAAIKTEIAKSVPRLEKLLKTWNLNPEEKIVYGNMLKRLKDGAKTDWAALHPIHARAGEGVTKLELGDFEKFKNVPESKAQIEKLVTGLSNDAAGQLERLPKEQRDRVLAALGKEKPAPTHMSQGKLMKFVKENMIYRDGLFYDKKSLDAGRDTAGKTYDQVMKKVFYQMGLVEKDGAFVSDKKINMPSRLRDAMSPEGKAGGGWRTNVPKSSLLWKALDAEEQNFRAANMVAGKNDPLKNVREKLKSLGYTEKQIATALRSELSHVEKTGESGRGPAKYSKGSAMFDLRLLNNYMNTKNRPQNILDWNAKNGNPLGLTPTQIKEFEKAANYMKPGAHPTTLDDIKLVQKSAQLDVLADEYLKQQKVKPKGFPKLGQVNASKGLLALLDDRIGTGYYDSSKPVFNLSSGVDQSQKVLVDPNNEFKVDTKTGKVTKLTNANTGAKPAGAVADSGSSRDRRTTTETRTQRVATRSQLASFRRGFGKIPGFSMPGKIKGDPGLKNPTVKQGQLALDLRSKGFSQAEIDRTLRRFAENEIKIKESQVKAAEKDARTEAARQKEKAAIQKRQTVDARKRYVEEQRRAELNRQQALHYNAAVKENQRRDLKNQKQTEKANIKNQRIARQEKIGRFSGGASAALGTAGMGLMMAGNEKGGMAMMGASAVAGMAPMLMNPVGAVAAGLLVAAGAIVAFNMALSKAKKEGIALGNAMSMTKGKLIELSKITNSVSASESADRKRADLLVGANEKQRKVGQTILESEFGKSLLADIETQVKAGFSSADIGKNMGVQLSAAMLSGVIDSDQARSLAMAIGNELKDYPLSANIAAEIIQITGPNGENIKKDPLKVALDIDKKTFETSNKMIDYASKQSFSYFNALSSYGGIASTANQLGPVLGGVLSRVKIFDRNENTSTLIGSGGTMASSESARRGEKGLSHRIQQAINPAIYQDWYDPKKSGLDKALSVLTFGTTSTYFQVRDAKAASLKIQTAGAQLMVQELANNQQLIDSLNKQYDIRLKTAKTEKERAKIQEERRAALDGVNAQNKNQINTILASKDKIGEDAWNAAIKGAVDELYPKGPQAALKDAALTQLATMPDSAFKTEMQLQFASNLIDPMTLIDLLSNEPFQKEYNILVDTTFKGDAAGASVFSQLMSKAGLGTDQKTNVTAMINDTTTYDAAMKNATTDEQRAKARGDRQEQIDSIKEAVAALSQIQETYGINLDVNDNSVAKVQRIADMVKALGGKKGVTKAELKIMADPKLGGDPRYQYIFDNWEALVGDGLTMSATMLLNLETMVTDDMILQGYLQAAGTKDEIQTNELMQKGMIPSWAQDRTAKEKAAAYFAANPAKFKEIFGVEYEGQDPPVKVADPLEFLQPLAMQLKQVRDNAFNALTPVKSLLEAFTNKQTQKDAFNLFDGIQNRLLKMGVGKDFREAIDSMSAEDFAKVAALTGDRALFTFEKGKARSKDTIKGLTDTGKAVDQGYRERNLGTFNLANEETIKDIQDQSKAYNILIGNGLSAAQALEVVADKGQAAALASGAISSSDPDWQTYITNIRLANTALERQATLNNAIKANEEFRLYADMPLLVSQMKELGYSVNQIDAVLGDPKLAKMLVESLKNGESAAKAIADYIDNIEARKIIDIQVALNKGDLKEASQNGRQLVDDLFAAQEGLILFGADAKLIRANEKEIADKQLQIAGFQQTIEKLNDQIEDGQRKIEESYTRPIEDLNEEINDLSRDLETNPLFGDRAIKKIQDESSVLSNDLEIINHAAEEVNKRYDEQADALSEIQKINENIVEQQSNQLDLADALSKGDISAAAQAVQAMREASASQFESDQSDALEQARQNELMGLVGPKSGLTAEQINEKQYLNAQKIYDMENDPTRLSILEMIIGKQDQIYSYEESRELALRGIRKLEDAISKIEEESIEPLQERIDALVYQNQVIQARIDKEIAELTVLGNTKIAWAAINAQLDAAGAAFAALNGSKDLAGLLASARELDQTWANIVKTLSLYAGAAPTTGPLQDAINAIGGPGANAYVPPVSTAEDIAAAAEFDRVVAELDKAQAYSDWIAENGRSEEQFKLAAARLAAAQAAYDATIPKYDANNVGGGGGLNSFRFMATGGMVRPKYFKTGGINKGTDTVPAMLTPGEFVVKRSAVKKYGSKFFKNLNDKKYSKNNKAMTPKEVLDIVRNLGSSISGKPKSAYDANNQPTGSPTGRYWGELERLYEGSPIGFDKNGKPIFNTTGKDPWGGTEIPGLPFSGKVANFSDYWHQLAEQPKASSSPGMGIDKTPDRYAGSGASMGGIGGGVYRVGGLQLFSKGGMVPHYLGMSSMGKGSGKTSQNSLLPGVRENRYQYGPGKTRGGFEPGFRKEQFEQVANFFGLPSIAKTGYDLAKYGGIPGMIQAKIDGKEMRSNAGDNLTAGLSVIPIPLMKLLKPLGRFASKIVPQGVKNFISDPVKGLGIDMFSKLSSKLNPSASTPTGSLVEQGLTPPTNPLPKDPNLWDDNYFSEPYFPTKTEKVLSSLANTGKVGLELSSLIYKTKYGIKDFVGGAKKPIESAWNYLDPNKRSTYPPIKAFGSALTAPLAKPVAKLAKEFNPYAISNLETNYKDLSYIQRSMIPKGGSRSEASYSTMFENITSDIATPIKAKLTGYKDSVKSKVNEKFGDTGFLWNLKRSAESGLTPERKAYYQRQAFIESVPGPLGALLQMKLGVHRSVKEIMDFPSPLERELTARVDPYSRPMAAHGPGLYSSTSAETSKIYRNFGTFEYGVSLTPKAILKVLTGKGILSTRQEKKFALKYQKKTGLKYTPTIDSMNSDITDPYMQAILKAGYIGYRPGTEFTNWGIGNIPGMHLKPIATPDTFIRKVGDEYVTLPGSAITNPAKPTLNSVSEIGTSKASVATLAGTAIGAAGLTGLSLYNAINANAGNPTLEDIVSNKVNKNSGGLGGRFAMQALSSGGLARGTDIVPAMLTPGEFVMSKYAVESHGADTMKAINNGSTVGDSVYNYSINVNVKSDSNPDEIARAVMTQIKSVDSQKIRGVRI
jgi:TP901 family phage tail tape measure protein